MRISEKAFLAGCISSDGCIYLPKGTYPRIELVATVESDWTDFVVNVAARANIAAYASEPKTHKLIHVQARSTLQAWIELREVSEYIMPRKWQIVNDFYTPKLADMERHVEAYVELFELINTGMSKYAAGNCIKKKYDIKSNTVQRWAYDGQKPKLLNLPEVINAHQ